MASPSSSYTCLSCRVSFPEAEGQRAHYKTDWHRYNLKRKVAHLPPVSAESFRERVLSQQTPSLAEGSSARYCVPCRKQFSSSNAFSSHVRSKRHQENLKSGPSEPHSPKPAHSAVSDTADSEPKPLDVKECLFCPQESSSVESNLDHMSREHGFFIPDLGYLVDAEGLLAYLCEKVGVGCMCLWCNDRGKTFHCVEAVQKHMVDKSHCRLLFDGDSALEYAEYYDYTSSYPQEDSPPVRLSDELELVLSTGDRLVHRSLKLKQHLPSTEQRRAALIGRLMTQYRALGTGFFTHEGRTRDQKWTLRMKQAKETKLKVKANKFQHHFRPQVVF